MCGGFVAGTPRPAAAAAGPELPPPDFTLKFPPPPVLLIDAWPKKVEIGALKANAPLYMRVTLSNAVITSVVPKDGTPPTVTVKRGSTRL